MGKTGGRRRESAKTNLSVQPGPEHEVETAAGRVDIGAGTTTENALSWEASEDRIVTGCFVKSHTDTTSELSFSSQMLTDTQPVTDEVSSGIIGIGNKDNTGTWFTYGLEGPFWHAGEEINLHVDNASASSALIVIVIAYIPVGDFLRERLRNR